MKPSFSTLNLMRQSVGAVVAAAALSGTVHGDVATATNLGSGEPTARASSASDVVASNVEKKEEPKKEEPKKEDPKRERQDPCPACGLG